MMYKTLFISLLDQKKNIAVYKLVKKHFPPGIGKYP